MEQLQHLIHDVERIMRGAGAIVLDYFHGTFTVTEKPNDAGPVTQADLASQQYIIEAVRQLLPAASIIAEEGNESAGNTADYCWVIDPLDGTTNFSHRLPYFCISVALTYKGAPVLGAIYEPLNNNFFHAYKDAGAFLNNAPLTITQNSMNKSLLVIGLPSAKNQYYQQMTRLFQDMAMQSYAIRHFGAAALDLAYVAAGRLDGIFLADLAWWDVAAGMLLIEEAGGRVTDFQGKPIDREYKTLIAGGPQVWERMREICGELK